MSDSDLLEDIVVRIYLDDTTSCGTGFLISEDIVVTCYHVLADENQPLHECYFAGHDRWENLVRIIPIKEKCQRLPKDVAILHCDSPPDFKLKKYPLVKWDSNGVNEFQSRGYDKNTPIRQGASNVEGRILSRTHLEHEPRLQLQTLRRTLIGGRSGSPVISKGVIVGMIDYRSGKDSILTDKCLAIPVEELGLGSLVKDPFFAIPIVIVSLTKEEALSLKNGNINEKCVLKFNKSLFEQNIKTWESFYDDKRENWRPLINPAKTIEEIINDISDRINEQRRLSGAPEIYWKIVSNEFFDSKLQSRIWLDLNKSGCIMIIDSISLFHPEVRKVLWKSQLLLNEKIIMLAISPINHGILVPNCLIEDLINDQLPTIISKLDTEFSGLCDIGIGDYRTLRRKLNFALPEVERTVKENLKRKNVNDFAQVIGEQKGFINAILSQRVG